MIMKNSGYRLGIAVIALLGAFSLAAAESAQKPNVLFISIDDMNHWISCMREYQDIYDYPAYNTPNIDKLMKRGVFFTNAHVPASSCRPSRVSTFTGHNVVAHGVYRNPHEWLISPILKGRADISLMQRFRKEGYWVAGGAKTSTMSIWSHGTSITARTRPDCPLIKTRNSKP